MKTQKINSKKFKFNKFITVGAPDAESDYDLEKVFIENGEIEVFKKRPQSKMYSYR